MKHMNFLEEEIEEEKLLSPEGDVQVEVKPGFLDFLSEQRNYNIYKCSGSLYYKFKYIDKKLKFVHTAPGYGTRCEVIKLTGLADRLNDNSFQISFSWEPEQISFSIDPPDTIQKDKLTSEKKELNYELIVIKGDRVAHQYKSALQKGSAWSRFSGSDYFWVPARLQWISARDTAKILKSLGNREDNFEYKKILFNKSITSLITGFEVFCQTRAIELPEEGRPVNKKAISDFLSSDENIDSFKDRVEKKHTQYECPVMSYIIENKINFQNWENCKNFYKKYCNLTFGTDLDFKTHKFERINDFLQCRHKIIHKSSKLFGLNRKDADPIYSKEETVKEAIQLFDSFIDSLMKATFDLLD